MFYVYGYFLPDSSVPFYIGKGKGSRMYQHLSPRYLAMPDAFHRYLASLLQSRIQVRIEVLWDGLTEDEAYEYEKDSIQSYGRKCDGTGPLLNISEGGEGSTAYQRTEEHKAKISEALKAYCSNPLVREERRQRMVGNTLTKGLPSKRRIRVARKIRGRIDKEYESLTEAAVAMDTSPGTIWAALSGRNKTCKGYEWTYLD